MRRLVYIEWVDSFGGGGWQPMLESTEEPEPLVCKSVGWLMVDGVHSKVIVPHIHEAQEEIGAKLSGCGDMTIPACAVLRMIDLVIE